MEKALGIRVVRHITKKPAGDAADLEKHFRLTCQLVALCSSMSCFLSRCDLSSAKSCLLQLIVCACVNAVVARLKSWS